MNAESKKEVSGKSEEKQEKIEEKKEETPESIKAEPETVFVICAHPDDEVLGAGATIAKYVKEGKNIKTIIFSYGELGIPMLQRKFSIEKRVKESKNADAMLGCKDSIFLGIDEGKFIEQCEERQLKEKLKEMFEKEKPSKIFTHSPDDPHPDHRAVYKTVLEIVGMANVEPDIYMFDIWNPINFRKRNNPRLYVDVSETFRIKLNALSMFKSQWPSLIILWPQVLISAFLNGMGCECRYAEKFYKIR